MLGFCDCAGTAKRSRPSAVRMLLFIVAAEEMIGYIHVLDNVEYNLNYKVARGIDHKNY